MKKIFQPVSKSSNDVSDAVTKTLKTTSEEKIKATANLNFDILNGMGRSEFYLMSFLSKTTNPEHTIQFKLVEGYNSNRVNDLLNKKTKPDALKVNLLKIPFRAKEFKLEGEFMKRITTKNYNVDLANLLDKKLMFEFAKEMFFDEKVLGNEHTTDKTPKKLPKPPAIIAFVISVVFLLDNPHELCDRIT